MSKATTALFSESGALASAVQGYQLRPGQQQLAGAIADNLEQGGVLVAEAGTGIGKTFAYLLPALASGQKVLVSTATKNLQEQIFQHDLPLARKVLTSTAKAALLKGRRNYFCHYHFSQLEQSDPADLKEKQYRAAIGKFAERTRDGDLVGLEGVPEDSPILDMVTSTADNCLGRDCDFFEECFVQQARQKAKEADIVVVNHHLLLADFALKSEGFAEILPDIDAFVIDEAHHLPNTAVQFLGKRLSFRQLAIWHKDAEEAVLSEAPDAVEARNSVKALYKAAQDTLLSVNRHGEARFDGAALDELRDFWASLFKLEEALHAAQKALGVQQSRGKLLANVSGRLDEMADTLAAFIARKEKQQVAEAKEVGEEPAVNAVAEARWLDTQSRGFMLCIAPVNAAGRFASWIRQSEASWAFLSATLAVGGQFTHFIRELGLPSDVPTLQLDSPFDYRMQAVLYHPANMPQPNARDYTEAVIDAALPLLKRSRGRAFLLFTSYRALYVAERQLKDSGFNLFVQGKAPKGKLLADFRRAERAVLLGTSSFWEGVDVRGEALVCVVIDKLPFAVPNDPLTRARHQLLEEKGLSPFMHDSLPQAVITLKQGVGRLIRDSRDYGVLMIADPRLSSKGYGKVFLDSLPRMTRTSQFAIVERFFNYHERHDAR
ncbi:ATP-dependent DNA helicase [Cardiobacteriaceae bacterium TAE3-ERU3]|nr:ATP-dependent DNA helicase [Cardiobacteriaceae bacterium TAE3-ERU3]